MKPKPFKVNIRAADLPPYLSPKIISAVGYIHQASPSIPNAIKRIDKMKNYLSEQELKWVMALLVFDRLVDMAQSSNEFKEFKNTVGDRGGAHPNQGEGSQFLHTSDFRGGAHPLKTKKGVPDFTLYCLIQTVMVLIL